MKVMECTDWVILNPEPGLWVVGVYGPDGKWIPDSDHDSVEEARDRILDLKREKIGHFFNVVW